MNNTEEAHGVLGSKFLVLSTAALLLIGASLFINNSSTLPSFSSFSYQFRYGQYASAVPALNKLYATDAILPNTSNASAKRNNIFVLKPLSEFRLFAPILKPIDLTASIVKITPSTPSTHFIQQTTPVVPVMPVTANPLNIPVAKQIANPISLPVSNSIANPLATEFGSKNINPESSVVNIICSETIASTAAGKTIKQISSSGILISSSGLILTNAHVGIHPFIAEYGNKTTSGDLTCKIRSGSTALTSHALSFVYISAEWTARHKGETNGIVGTDSGESDFAILKASNPTDILKFVTPASIRNTTSPNPLLIFSKDHSGLSFSPDIRIGESITAIGYPILSNDPNSLLKRHDALSVRDLYGFSGGTDHDLIETTASTIAKNGSSGGAIVDSEQYLIGMIANVIPTEDPDKAYIRAISLDHIQSALFKQSGIDLYTLIHGDGSSLKEVFESKYLGSVKSDLL